MKGTYHKLIFEGKPFSVNQTYRRGKGRKMYMDNRAKAYGESVGWQAKAQWRRKRILKGDLEVTFKYYFHRRGIDHLNCNKLLADFLEQIVYANDNQIKISHHYTNYSKENPRIELIIKEIN